MIDWYKKKNVTKVWVDRSSHVWGTLWNDFKNLMESGNYGFPIAVAFCGIGFAYDL